MRLAIGTLIALCLLVGAGCRGRDGETALAKFKLPGGDVEAGKATFESLRCYACHIVVGQPQMPDPYATGVLKNVRLGGAVPSRPNRELLADKILHPAHQLLADLKFKEGDMPDYSYVVTVRQLSDLVEFLHSTYTQEPQGSHSGY